LHGQAASSPNNVALLASGALDKERLSLVLKALERSGDSPTQSQIADVKACIDDAQRTGEIDEARICTLAVVLFRARRAQSQIKLRLEREHPTGSLPHLDGKPIHADLLEKEDGNVSSPIGVRACLPTKTTTRNRRKTTIKKKNKATKTKSARKEKPRR
jgi:hypothetical protein